MKNATFSLVAILAVVIAAPALAEDGNVSQTTLSSLGLGDLQQMSDAEGTQVRGKFNGNGGVIGTSLISFQLLTPDGTILTQNQYNKVFTAHGAIMVFLVIIPAVPAALGNFVLPIMLGAKDVAFPKLNLFSWWLWVFGFFFFLLALAGGVDTGWTFYTPYSLDQTTGMSGIIPVLIGAFILGFSSIFTGMNFIVTIHRLRPPGWRRASPRPRSGRCGRPGRRRQAGGLAGGRWMRPSGRWRPGRCSPGPAGRRRWRRAGGR